MAEATPTGAPISVVIPVRNEAAKIQSCIEGLIGQTIPISEIIVVDSGSTDGTLEILERYPGVRVISIAPETFNHGEARNIGVREAAGDWVFLTVGDAAPADERWAEKMFAGILDDGVVGVCGKQIVPRDPNANPLDWFAPVSAGTMERFQFATAAEFDRLSSTEKLRACSWDDVSALYRRDILLRIPFRPVMFGEDALWAKDALRAGSALVYQPAARMYHFHRESAEFTFRRTIVALCFRFREFGYRYPKPRWRREVLRAAKRLVREPSLTLADRKSWLQYNWRNQIALRDAMRVFAEAADRGEESVASLCAQYSDRPPIPDKD